MKTVHMASAVLAVGLLAGCQSEPPPPDYISVELTEAGSPESCRLDIYIEIDKEIPLRMIEYDRRENGQRVGFSQWALSTHNRIDVRRVEGKIILYEDGPCSAMDVEWYNFRCQNEMREDMECPDVQITGTHTLAGIRATP